MSTVMKRMTALIVVALLALAGAFLAVSVDTAQAAKKPAKVSGVTAKAASDNHVAVTWKVAKRATTYQVRYANNKKMKKAKSITVKGATAKAATIKGLKAKTKYYVQVRAKNGKKAGKWSSKKTVTTSKAYTVRANLQAYSWAEVKAIANKISLATSKSEALATAKTYHLVASNGKLTGNETKTVDLYGGGSTQVAILGFWHDNKVGGGKAGITFGFTESLTFGPMNAYSTGTNKYTYGTGLSGTQGNEYGWKNSCIRQQINDVSNFMSVLPYELSSGIVKVSKRTNNTGLYLNNDAKCVSVTEDALWLLSASECYGSLSAQGYEYLSNLDNYDAEGTQYQLWSDLGVTLTNCSAFQQGGSMSVWLRSPNGSSTKEFCCIDPSGELNYDDAKTTCGTFICFCL